MEGSNLSSDTGNAPEHCRVTPVKLEPLYAQYNDGDDDVLCQKYALNHY